MTTSRPGRRALAVGAALSLALALGACGGDDDAADETTTTTTAATTTEAPASSDTTEGPAKTTEAGPDEDEAQALAESINLTIDDFAEGWTAEDESDDGEDELDACFTEVDVDAAEVASAESPSFQISNDDGSQGQAVQTKTIVLDEEGSAEDMVAEVATNRFAGCAEDALIASFEDDGPELTSSGLDPVEDTGGLGDGAGGVAGAISFVGGDGNEYTGQLALYFIRTQNVVTAISIFDIGDLGFEATLSDLLAEVASNQADALG